MNNVPVNLTDPMGLRPCDNNLDTYEDWGKTPADENGEIKGLIDFLNTNSGTACLTKIVTSGDGRAVVKIGREWAHHVVIAPVATGASITANFAAGPVSWINDIRNAANSSDVMVVAWLDYDAPDGIVGAWRGGTRKEEIDSLASLTNHYSGQGQHVSLLGYSYGATMVTGSVQQSGARAGDLICIGPSTDRLTNSNGAKVWLGYNGDDPWYRTDGPDQDRDHFGRNVTLFSTAGNSGHNYFQGESLRNMARIVAGQYCDVSTDYAPVGFAVGCAVRRMR